MGNNYLIDEKILAFLKMANKRWPVIEDVVNRVLKMNGDGVSNTQSGITVRQLTRKQRPSPTSGGGGGTTIWVKTVGASTASSGYNYVSCKTWDGTTLGSTAFNVLVAAPIPSGVTLHATKVDHTGVTITGTEITYIEVVGGFTGSEVQIGDSIEGSDSADTVSADSGSTNQAIRVYRQQRTVYDDATNQVLRGYARSEYIQSRGLTWKVTAEPTGYIIDTPESCGSTSGGTA